MKKNSIKLNFIMNTILMLSAFIFPLITFPYVSRVLGAEGNGRINFVSSIVDYIINIAMIGIPLYGIKVTALNSNDKNKLSKVVHEIMMINIFLGVISLMLLFFLVLFIPKLYSEWQLFLILSSKVVFLILGMEWLFKGLEEYSYIAIRSLIFKIISIILMFFLVKNETDYINYAVLVILAGCGSYIINMFRARKYIIFKPFKEYNLKQHIVPLLSFFALTISAILYTNIDTTMLGFLIDNKEVGYYGVAVKIKAIIISIITSLSVVLIPRVIQIFNEENLEKAYNLIKKNTNFIFVSSLYFIGFFLINSKESIIFISGNKFLPAIPVLQVIVIDTLLNGLVFLIGTSILVAKGKEKITLYANILGIIINILCNIYFITYFKAVGAAIATIISTIAILLFQAIYLRKEIKNYFDFINIFKILISISISMIVLVIFKNFVNISNIFISILVLGVVYTTIFGILLNIFKESIIIELEHSIINKIKDKMKNKKQINKK